MKWIKGKWDKTSNTIYVNPAFITAIDVDRQLLWADDCDVAVRYDKEEDERLHKLAGIPLEDTQDTKKKKAGEK